MTAPRYEMTQKIIHNPHASGPLIIPILVICNTPDEVLNDHIRVNSARDLEWLSASGQHDGVAVMIGGGPSAADHIDDIRALKAAGATVFAMNGASKWARGHGIPVDYQVISDAKEETATLVDSGAAAHLFASQVNPKTIEAVKRPIIWHLETGEVEQLFPEKRVKAGGYALIGGGAATGNCAMCVAFALGFREFHVFGYDSSHRDGKGHAYSQPMNDLIPTTEVQWGGREFTCSVAMKAQAEKFQITSQALKQEGCQIEVYGDGLLQCMYTTPPHSLSERDKYRLMWQFDGYRDIAPGEQCAAIAARFFDKPGPVIDFGCGTGRSSLRLKELGFDVILVDFADNCRDDEAFGLPFVEWDMSHPCPLLAPFGLCTDMMEHIPTDDVDAVVTNIMTSAAKVFFQISTVNDSFGAVIHQKLHNTVRPHEWWQSAFVRLGYSIHWQEKSDINSCFVVTL
jgi:hypothetical protein